MNQNITVVCGDDIPGHWIPFKQCTAIQIINVYNNIHNNACVSHSISHMYYHCKRHYYDIFVGHHHDKIEDFIMHSTAGTTTYSQQDQSYVRGQVILSQLDIMSSND